MMALVLKLTASKFSKGQCSLTPKLCCNYQSIA